MHLRYGGQIQKRWRQLLIGNVEDRVIQNAPDWNTSAPILLVDLYSLWRSRKSLSNRTTLRPCASSRSFCKCVLNNGSWAKQTYHINPGYRVGIEGMLIYIYGNTCLDLCMCLMRIHTTRSLTVQVLALRRTALVGKIKTFLIQIHQAPRTNTIHHPIL